MGPGVPGLEDDPPSYHFDIDDKDFEQLITDPAAFLGTLGLGPAQGVAMDGVVNVQLPNMAWSDDGWQPLDETQTPKARHKCIHVYAQLIIAWPHH